MFSKSINHSQFYVIKGYNDLIDVLKKKLPDKAKNFIKMSENGICSADTTKWLEGMLSAKDNETIYSNHVTKRQKLGELGQLKSTELMDWIDKNNEEANKLAEYGDSLQRLHSGSEYTSNIEKKNFLQQMRAIWLYSLPLIVSNEHKKNILKAQLSFKPDALRFLSEYHVIGAFVNNDTVIIHDPNDAAGDQHFNISDIDAILSYLDKRFSVINEKLEIMSVFVSNDTKHPDIIPESFVQLKDCFHGINLNNNIDLFSLFKFMQKLHEKFKSAQQDTAEIDKIKKMIDDFNQKNLVVDLNFMGTIIDTLKTIREKLEKDESLGNLSDAKYYLQVFSSMKSRMEIKNSLSVSIDYLIKIIYTTSKNIIKNDSISLEYNSLLQNIIDLSEQYFNGSNSLDYLAYGILKALTILTSSKEKLLIESFRWHQDQLSLFLNSSFFRFKTKVLHSIPKDNLTYKFDVVLLNWDMNEKIDPNRLQQIINENGGKPILIQKGENIWIFGMTSYQVWNLTKLSKECFKELNFPKKHNQILLLSADRLNEKMVSQIKQLKAHCVIRDRNNLDVAINMSNSHAVQILLDNVAGSKSQYVYCINDLVPYKDESIKYLTPLESAVRVNNAEIVRLLCINNANPAILTTTNSTIVHHLNLFINPEMIDFFLRYGMLTNEIIYFEPPQKGKCFIDLLRLRISKCGADDTKQLDFNLALKVCNHLLIEQTKRRLFLDDADQEYFLIQLIKKGGFSETVQKFIEWKIQTEPGWLEPHLEELLANAKDLNAAQSICMNWPIEKNNDLIQILSNTHQIKNEFVNLIIESLKKRAIENKENNDLEVQNPDNKTGKKELDASETNENTSNNNQNDNNSSKAFFDNNKTQLNEKKLLKSNDTKLNEKINAIRIPYEKYQAIKKEYINKNIGLKDYLSCLLDITNCNENETMSPNEFGDIIDTYHQEKGPLRAIFGNDIIQSLEQLKNVALEKKQDIPYLVVNEVLKLHDENLSKTFNSATFFVDDSSATKKVITKLSNKFSDKTSVVKLTK